MMVVNFLLHAQNDKIFIGKYIRKGIKEKSNEVKTFRYVKLLWEKNEKNSYN